MRRHTSVETKYHEERDAFLQGLRGSIAAAS